MIEQLTMEITDEAITRAEAHALPDWKTAARMAIITLAHRWREFNSDDIWTELIYSKTITHEHRALGAIVRQAIKDGIIESTGRYVPSLRAESHRRPIMIYRSKVTTNVFPH